MELERVIVLLLLLLLVEIPLPVVKMPFVWLLAMSVHSDE